MINYVMIDGTVYRVRNHIYIYNVIGDAIYNCNKKFIVSEIEDCKNELDRIFDFTGKFTSNDVKRVEKMFDEDDFRTNTKKSRLLLAYLLTKIVLK